MISTSCCALYGYWTYSDIRCGVYCNDRIFVQTIDDLIYHDIKYPNLLYYSDLSSGGSAKSLVFDPSTGSAKIPKSTAVRVTYNGGVFSVNSWKFEN